ncbi:hypothetical protein [Streptococcus sp. HF-1907]|uniref:hypothetical protein n=1 Tax=Streptococcus sp. HF-1907 TaxID=2785793 RepID=UPI001E32DBDD|nr:hypothetical protein [Streptococcus sp. HF-1907]
MTNKLKSLLWLRWQFLLSNKLFLILVVSPPLYILLMSSMGDSTTTSAFIGTGMSVIYSISAGSFISMMISEEKEKKNLKTLILSGVKQSEYFFSVLIFPVCLSFLFSILVPLILHIDHMAWKNFLIVVFLTIIVFVLLNLLIAFLAKN